MRKWYQYQYTGTYKTYDRAEEVMNDLFADGEIDSSQCPEVMPIHDHRRRVLGYAVFLDDNGLKYA